MNSNSMVAWKGSHGAGWSSCRVACGSVHLVAASVGGRLPSPPCLAACRLCHRGVSTPGCLRASGRWQPPCAAEARPAHLVNSLKTRPSFSSAATPAPASAVAGRVPHEAAQDWSRSDWAGAYATTAEEPEGYWLTVEGTLPAELKGTYFRNGPGEFEVGQQAIAHPFDGHGLVTSLAIKDGRAFFRSRYVRTAEFKQERKQQRVLFRASFGTQRPGGPWANALDVIPKNVANTNVMLWGGRCLALFEAGQPHRLDPFTLATQGLDLLGGCLQRGVPFEVGHDLADQVLAAGLNLLGIGHDLPGGIQLGGDALAAHPHVDPKTGHLVMFSYRIKLGAGIKTDGPRHWLPSLTAAAPALVTALTFWEFDQDYNLVGRVEHELPGYAFLHDIAVTESHYVAFQNPVSLDLAPFLLGQRCPAHCVHWEDGPTKIHLVPRAVVPSANPAQHAPEQAQHSGWASLFGCDDMGDNPAARHRTASAARSSTAHMERREVYNNAVVLRKAATRQLAVASTPSVSGRSSMNASNSSTAQPTWRQRGSTQLSTAPTSLTASAPRTASQPGPAPSATAWQPPSTSSSDHDTRNPHGQDAGGHASSSRPRPPLADRTGTSTHSGRGGHLPSGFDSQQRKSTGSIPQQLQHQKRRQALQDGETPRSTASGHQELCSCNNVRVVQGDAAFVFHHANAYEVNGGQGLVVECVRYPEMPNFSDVSGPGHNFYRDIDPETQPISQLWRYTIDLQAGSVKAEQLSARAMEYPVINPAYAGRQHRYVYAAAALHPDINRPQQAVAKMDVETGEVALWSRGHRYYVGEPQFIARTSQPAADQSMNACDGAWASSGSESGAAEDDGWVLALCYDAEQKHSEYVVLDARNIQAGPLAVMRLAAPLPHGLHGNWVGEYFGPDCA